MQDKPGLLQKNQQNSAQRRRRKKLSCFSCHLAIISIHILVSPLLYLLWCIIGGKNIYIYIPLPSAIVNLQGWMGDYIPLGVNLALGHFCLARSTYCPKLTTESRWLCCWKRHNVKGCFLWIRGAWAEPESRRLNKAELLFSLMSIISITGKITSGNYVALKKFFFLITVDLNCELCDASWHVLSSRCPLEGHRKNQVAYVPLSAGERAHGVGAGRWSVLNWKWQSPTALVKIPPCLFTSNDGIFTALFRIGD